MSYHMSAYCPAINACLFCSHYQVAFFRLHYRHFGVFNILFLLRVRKVREQLFCFLLTLVAVNRGFLWLGSRDGSGVSIPVWYRVALVLPWLEYKQGDQDESLVPFPALWQEALDLSIFLITLLAIHMEVSMHSSVISGLGSNVRVQIRRLPSSQEASCRPDAW